MRLCQPVVWAAFLLFWSSGADAAGTYIHTARAFAAPPVLRVQDGPTRKAGLIQELLRETNATKLVDDIITAMLPAVMREIDRRGATIPDDVRRLMGEEIVAEFRRSTGEFVDNVSGIYDRHLTEEDLEALLAFYRTPTGRKMSGLAAQIAGESMAIGQRWGIAVGQRAMRRAVAKARQMGVEL